MLCFRWRLLLIDREDVCGPDILNNAAWCAVFSTSLYSRRLPGLKSSHAGPYSKAKEGLFVNSPLGIDCVACLAVGDLQGRPFAPSTYDFKSADPWGGYGFALDWCKSWPRGDQNNRDCLRSMRLASRNTGTQARCERRGLGTCSQRLFTIRNRGCLHWWNGWQFARVYWGQHFLHACFLQIFLTLSCSTSCHCSFSPMTGLCKFYQLLILSSIHGLWSFCVNIIKYRWKLVTSLTIRV